MIHLSTWARALDIAQSYLRAPLDIEGIDVSHHQREIDWGAVADS